MTTQKASHFVAKFIPLSLMSGNVVCLSILTQLTARNISRTIGRKKKKNPRYKETPEQKTDKKGTQDGKLKRAQSM